MRLRVRVDGPVLGRRPSKRRVDPHGRIRERAQRGRGVGGAGILHVPRSRPPEQSTGERLDDAGREPAPTDGHVYPRRFTVAGRRGRV